MPGNLIEELTEEQLALLDVWRDKWKDIGYSTEPADRPAAESAIVKVYESTNRAPPERIVWCGSPMEMAESREIYCQQTGNTKHQWFMPDASMELWDTIIRIDMPVWDTVGSIVRQSIQDSPFFSTRAVWRHQIAFGQHKVCALACLDFYRHVFGLQDQFDPWVNMIDVAKAAGWWIPQENICWVSERPSAMHRDDLGRLHNVSGPALQYPDGWSIYAVGGVLVPAEFVEDRATIDPTRAITEPNAEHRQALTQILGWDRVLDHVTLLKVSEDRYGTLFETPLFADDGDLPARFVQVYCTTTGRMYQFRVPPDCTTPRHALGWKYHPSRPAMGHDVDPLWYSPDAES